MDGQPLSEAVRDAASRGYTEPRPQDDLSGVDVARKALILARELGLEVDLDDVQIEPLVSAELIDIDDVGAFFAALERNDATFARSLERARGQGKVLRYLAQIDPSSSTPIRVGPVFVDAAHPATRLRGTEAMVAFVTDRFEEYPLIVQGPGAGGDVTAAGVLTDVLRISRGLRA